MADRTRTITLEEHFTTQSIVEAARGAFSGGGNDARQRQLQADLLDLGEGRIRAMDEGGVDLQVLSVAALALGEFPAAQQGDLLAEAHDLLAAAVAAYPGRFAGFCSPGLKDVQRALAEIDRCIRELGFVGVLVDGTTDGKFLDAPEFLPVLERVAELGVPLYVHPAPPPERVYDTYFAGLPEPVARTLSIAGWGWHAETALHALRLIVSGTLDRVPSLRVVVGHMGEMLPFALARSSHILTGVARRDEPVAETLKRRFWFTTSGYFTRPPYDCFRAVLGTDHLMYSVDYPFSPNTAGEAFLRSLELEPSEEAAMRSGRAAELFGLSF